MNSLLTETAAEKLMPFEGFEAKMVMILQNKSDRDHLNSLTNDNARYEFFINHFIMSDMEMRQIRSFIISYGLQSFITLLKHYLDQTSDN
ncbi:hypothetical protein [Fulvivirga lutimaris]|uniref:hypothetical protein n=1 Tax=Fulvivirga lutimaris TaxID=1819566 RepID=UPI0012BBADBA|nr:hypothetical protein [Fulvivirga lutimaris]MTI38496.1 hypothetical protein [Fulvivirga lutimaris]